MEIIKKDTSLLKAAALYFIANGGFEQLKEVDGVVYKSNEWQELIELTEEETAGVNTKHQELINEATTTEYQYDRATAYPTIQEQLDMQYWDSVNGTTIWADTIAAIKAQYPKS